MCKPRADEQQTGNTPPWLANYLVNKFQATKTQLGETRGLNSIQAGTEDPQESFITVT